MKKKDGITRDKKESSMDSRLSIERRETIAKDLAAGLQVVSIAGRLGRNRATIFREICPSQAHTNAEIKQRARRQGKNQANNQTLGLGRKTLEEKGVARRN